MEPGRRRACPGSERERRAAASAARAGVGGPGATADGYTVQLLANVGGPGDVAGGRRRPGPRASGLFRTEFLFLDDSRNRRSETSRSRLPPGARRLPRRARSSSGSLDAGADKPLPFLTPSRRAQPGAGRTRPAGRYRPPRGARPPAGRARAAPRADRSDLWVMAPMVATAAEAAVRRRAAGPRASRAVGVMVEIPSAALRADRSLATVDFVSLGTNDLAQYAFAADRQVGAVAELQTRGSPRCSTWSRIAPAPRRERASPPVSAARPRPTRCCRRPGRPLVRPLSMAPRAVADVRGQLGDVDLETCRRAAEAARGADDAGAARAAVAQLLGV